MDPEQVAAMRRQYAGAGLDTGDLAPSPFEQFGRWLADAISLDLPEPNAMVLATADAVGQPSGRHVLLKSWDERGFGFFTNYSSRKGIELAANPRASLVFPWFAVSRQVVVVGAVERMTRAETDAYFATRPRGSQLGAWASEHQSAVVGSRAELDEAYRRVEERFAGEPTVPTPPFWGGLRVVPATVEFWQGRADRMHDRLRYVRDGQGWHIQRLSP